MQSEQKLTYDGVETSIFNNRVFYKNNSNVFSLGVFNSIDGAGLEVGFRFGGVHLKLPFFLLRNELDLEEIGLKKFTTSLVEFAFWGAISAGANFICSFIISKISKFQKSKNKNLITESALKEKQDNVMLLRDKYLKTLDIITKSAEKYHLIELDKKEKGLIIHLALYGKFEKLEKYKKDFDYISNKLKNAKAKNINTNTDEYNIAIKIKEYKIDEECDNIENEIVDVTMPVRNKISSNTVNTYSSVLFRELTKTSVFGFYNPIFKSEDMPYLMIM